jgi:hypothetical protein
MARMQFHKRRQYIVNKAVQYSSVAFVFAIVLAILAVHTWLTYWRLADKVRPEAGALPLSTMLLIDVVVTLAITGLFIGYAVIFGSHKVAGPLYRCEQAMKRLQKGDLTDFIKLRRGDFLTPFAEEVNLALANLREMAAEDRVHVQEAVRQLALARGAINAPDVQKTLDRATEVLAKIGHRLKIDRDTARILASSAVSRPTPVPGEESRMTPLPHGRAATPIYQAAKTMMLTPPDRTTLRGEQRAPGAGIPIAGDPGGATMVLPPPGASAPPPPPGPPAPAAAGPAYAPGGPLAALAYAPPQVKSAPSYMAATVAHRPAFVDAHGGPLAPAPPPGSSAAPPASPGAPGASAPGGPPGGPPSPG